VVRALVLTPTRELAAQVGENVASYGKFPVDLRSDVVFGGVNINPQIKALRAGVDVLVATPGRLLDLHGTAARHPARSGRDPGARRSRPHARHGLHPRHPKLLALWCRSGARPCCSRPPSATRSASWPMACCTTRCSVQVTPQNRTATTVEHLLHPCDMARKPRAAGAPDRQQNWQQVLVFTRTKHGANRMAEKLSKHGMAAAAIHGNKSQGARTRALAGFKSGELRVLVATDLAARGIDIHQLPHVVNLDLPNQAEDYVHRIGRTGRAGHPGHAISLVAAEEHELLRAIERLIGSGPAPAGGAGLRAHGAVGAALGSQRRSRPQPRWQWRWWQWRWWWPARWQRSQPGWRQRCWQQRKRQQPTQSWAQPSVAIDPFILPPCPTSPDHPSAAC
jgi:ATP-dependent RNA helicase RhlE